jgi:hypothetical protein
MFGLITIGELLTFLKLPPIQYLSEDIEENARQLFLGKALSATQSTAQIIVWIQNILTH